MQSRGFSTSRCGIFSQRVFLHPWYSLLCQEFSEISPLVHRLRRLTSFISDTSSSLSIFVSRKVSATSIYIYLSTVCMLVLLLFILSTVVQCINIALNLPYELNLYIRRRIANMWCINEGLCVKTHQGKKRKW